MPAPPPSTNGRPTMNKLMRHAALALLVGVVLAVAPPPSEGAIAGLEATEAPVAEAKQSRTIKLINYLIDKSHYHKQPLDDSFSEVVLETYLDRLDPRRNVFVQSDIDQFETLRHQFDDFIRDGTLHPVFLMFNILRTRIEQRVEYALERLNEPFDFALDETYPFNREDAQWARSTGELDDLWRKRIKNDIFNLRLAGKDEADIRDTLKQRYTHMARRNRQFNAEDVFQIFVNAYINAIEPHTSYFSPRAGENFQIQMRLSLEGIGAVLQTDNEYTQVRRIIPGGPADAGRELKAEDRIIGVAQGAREIVDVIGWRLDDVVELIRGPKASVVRLEILPGEGDPDSQPKVISIQRDKINLEDQAAKKRTMEIETPGGKSTIGVIDLPSFYIDFDGKKKKLPGYRSTTRDVRKLLGEFQPGEIDGLVIDLRGNSGGALTEAISLTGLFIKQGPVVQVRDARGRVQINRDPNPAIVYDGPLAVLVDRYSASASEIFAGAIQDYRRGLIIGEPTFGKGTVQHLVNLDRYAKNDGNIGQLKVTIAQFFRINGDSTQHRGVIPDIIWPTAGGGDPSGERAHENAIPWRRINGAAFRPFQSEPDPAAFARIRNLHEQRIQASPEFQYFMAVKEINEENRRKKSISLNETTRERERAERDQQRLELENRKRRALGRDAVVSVEELDRENEEKLRAAEASRLEQAPDAFLREGGRILSDYLHALKSPTAHDSSIAKQGQP